MDAPATKFVAVDLPEVDWSRAREVSIVCFSDDAVTLVRHRGQLVLPCGRPNPGEDVWDDTVRRIPLESMGFRHESTHVFAIDTNRRHVVFWVDGAPDDRSPHASTLIRGHPGVHPGGRRGGPHTAVPG